MAPLYEPTTEEIQAAIDVFSTGGPEELEQEYFRRVLTCAGNSTKQELSNSDPQHAAFIMKLFFERAKDTIRILTGSLYDGVYGISQVSAAARKFIVNGGTLQIAYRDSMEFDAIRRERRFFQSIKDLMGENADSPIKVFNASWIEPAAGITHFAVQDKASYRFEKDTVRRTASVDFGDGDSAIKLADVFDRIIKRSATVWGTV